MLLFDNISLGGNNIEAELAALIHSTPPCFKPVALTPCQRLKQFSATVVTHQTLAAGALGS